MRRATPEESATLDEMSEGTLSSWLRDRRAELWVIEKPRATFHLVSTGLAARLDAMLAGAAPKSTGLPVAEVTRGRAHWTLEGAREIGRRVRSHRVTVNDKSAGLFLYGRDVLSEGVIRMDPGLKRGDEAFVLNQRGDVLGVARVVGSRSAKGRVLEPIIDLGWYLRSGG